MRKSKNMTVFFISAFFLAGSIFFYMTGEVFGSDAPRRETVRRDLFVPLIGVDSAKTKRGIESIYTLVDVKFHGIATGAGDKKAVVLNGEIIQEGETIGLVTLVSVGSNDARILIDGKEHTISLYETKL